MPVIGSQEQRQIKLIPHQYQQYQILNAINQMENLKKAYKSSFAKSPLDVIFWGEPSLLTFQEAAFTYQSSSPEQKSAIQQRIFRKLNKNKEPQIYIAILILVDKLSRMGYSINLKDVCPKIDISAGTSPKGKVAGEAFIKFYLLFLQIETKKIIKPKNLQEEIKSCSAAIEAILKVMEFDYVIEYCLSAYEHRTISRIAMSSVLERVGSDLKMVNQFLERNWSNIINKHPLAFSVNQIYEKALHISKSAAKLELIRKKLNIQIELKFYKLDYQSNKQIEQEMISRGQEKKHYCSLKIIQSKLGSQEQINGPSSVQEEEENEIMMQKFVI